MKPGFAGWPVRWPRFGLAIGLAWATCRWASSPNSVDNSNQQTRGKTDVTDKIEVGFCDQNGRGFFKQQRPDQLERWELPYSNSSHVIVNWRADPRVCSANVTSYFVDVRTSLPVLNLFIGMFGKFPQDVCGESICVRACAVCPT